jgi:hypothetical protein
MNLTSRPGKSLNPTSRIRFQRSSIVGRFAASATQQRMIISLRTGWISFGIFGRSKGRVLIDRRMIIAADIDEGKTREPKSSS